MNKQEIEALVLSVVDRVLNNGQKVEDSLIECKREWPDRSKARQLAGHANSARGEEIVWIIGIDETGRKLTSPESPDLADWWSGMSSRFDDHVVPEMRDLIVQVTPKEFVTALVFSTDRAPYVIKVASSTGPIEREVPIRDGTRTRSSYRHELLRLLRPAAVPPPASLIYVHLTGRARSQKSVSFTLRAHLYIDQRPDETVMLPYHLMQSYLKPVVTAYNVQIEDSIAMDLTLSSDTSDENVRMGPRGGLMVSQSLVVQLLN